MSPDDGARTVQRLIVPEIVALPAEIDITNAGQVGAELAKAFQSHPSVVIADMSLTVFCDSSGVRQLLIASDAASECKSELRLVVASDAVVRVFRILGVDAVLKVYRSMGQALGDPGVLPRVSETESGG
jgi:anti-anti-sigma factor